MTVVRAENDSGLDKSDISKISTFPQNSPNGDERTNFALACSRRKWWGNDSADECFKGTFVLKSEARECDSTRVLSPLPHRARLCQWKT